MKRSGACVAFGFLIISFMTGAALHAVSCNGSNLTYSETGNSATSYSICGTWGRCQPPVGTLVSYSLSSPSCDPTAGSCAMTATVSAEYPGNHQNDPGAAGFFYSFAEIDLRDSSNGLVSYCGTAGAVIQQDFGTATVSASVSCSNRAAAKYRLDLISCPGHGCIQTSSVDLDFAGPGAANCPNPPPDDCDTCLGCIKSGGGGPAGCSNPARGGGPACTPEGSGPGAHLRYRAGGAGGTGLPGSTDWKTALGLYWSHDYAQRIVVAPNSSHVWLITERASFREFGNLASGSGLRLYQSHSPSDEYRKLYYDTSSGGWRLDYLDGRVDHFRADGLWEQTVRAQNSSNPTVGTYNGSDQLVSVSFPDGRSETFTYDVGGKLETITEEPVSGSGTSPRTWTYLWTGDELTGIERPDGTSWELTYDSTANVGRAGYLTQASLIGTDNTTARVEAAFEYDSDGNVIKSWSGDTSFTGTDAVDRQEFTYDNPQFPASTEVLEWIDGSTSETTTYELSRDPVSIKARIDSISGDCPVCGTGPNSLFTYGDSGNPLLATQVVDGRGLTTQFAYNSNGRVTSKTESVGTSLERLTTWVYGDSNFPAFPTRIEKPSTSGGSALRVTELDYDSDGNLETRTIEGAESGGSFSHDTVMTYNGSGRPLTVNPPGYSTSDQTSYTYDSGRGDFIPLTRTDPVIGATTFDYDGFNRQTSVTDPNGVETVTAFDELNRILTVTQLGASPPTGDLETTYEYNLFGDLFRVTRPEGNVIEYGYDPAGRLTSIERRPNTSTHGERASYTLDAYGHRTKEERQRWNGSAWVTENETEFLYTSRCHLDKAINADSTVTEYAYDCDGNLEKIWDANHPRGTFATPTQLLAYDALNRLASRTEAWSGGGTAVTEYNYDVQDHLSEVTDAEGNVTSYTTSDRDLMTEEVSEISGTTTLEYNEHGRKVEETDARPVTVERTYDAFDRLTFVDYADNSMDTTYTYDDVGVSFSKGRLTEIDRGATSIDYTYDRFGRMLQDGAVEYSYDKNGNVETLEYPNGVTATYTYDFADRQSTLVMQDGSNPAETLVSASSYKPLGPLASLSLGNGLTETHDFDSRYLPADITVSSSLLSWTYGHDDVGNPTSIADNLDSVSDRTYEYQDPQYFLTAGNGPWGNRWEYTYDKIGNRLSDPVNGTYSYIANGATGNTPRIEEINPGVGFPSAYAYDAVGNVADTDSNLSGAPRFLFTYGDDRRMSQSDGSKGPTTYTYDGRGFLANSELTVTSLSDVVVPTFGSNGSFLHRNAHRGISSPVSDSDLYVFYLAGRPVATLDNLTVSSSTTSSLQFFAVDHLGTPILVTDDTGTEVWRGGPEPSGALYTFRSSPTLDPPLLSYPGQWSDSNWDGRPQDNFGLRYNLNRWYDPTTGLYTSPDPIGLDAMRRAELFGLGVTSPYLYTDDNPINRIDPLGDTWYDWIPFVKPIKCVYYGNQCRKKAECCLRVTGLGNLYSGDEEDIARRFERFGGHGSPQWIECIQKTPECSKWLEYCGGTAVAPTHKIPGMGRDPSL